MTALLDTVRAKFLTRRSAARRELAVIAERELTGKANRDDAEALEKALADSGFDEKGYINDRACVAKRLQLRALAVQLEPLVETSRKSALAEQAYREEFRRMEAQGKAELARLSAASQTDYSRQERAARATRELQVLEWEHAETFGIERPNLDELTPVCGLAGDLPSHYDPAAPTLAVPVDVFRREHERRHRLVMALQVSHEKAQDEKAQAWQARRKDWERTETREFTEPQPRRVHRDFTWADALEAVRTGHLQDGGR